MDLDNPINQIIEDAALAWGLTVSDVRTKCREAHLIPARQLAMAVAYATRRETTPMTEMAKIFGLRPEGRSSITLAHQIVAASTGRQRRLYDALTRKHS